MLLKTDINISIDTIKINFDTEALWILNIALAVIMFGVALSIKLTDFKRLLQKPKLLLVGVFSQFFLLPALTFVAILIIKPHPSFALGMMMIAACPGGNVSNFFSKMAKGNEALSVSLTIFSTVTCLIMTPFNLQFYGGLYEPTSAILKTVELNPFELFKLVLLILGIPVVLGVALNYYNENIAKKIENVLKPFSMIIYLVLIGIVFYENIEIFLEYLHLIVALVIFHNIGAYIIGFYTAKGFGLNKKNRKTISMETGIQNAGLGLLLIFQFFDGLGGMAFLVGFWGIWNIFSGMIIGAYWGRKNN